MENICILEVRGPSGPQLLVGGPSGHLDFVLRALRALRPCHPDGVKIVGYERTNKAFLGVGRQIWQWRCWWKAWKRIPFTRCQHPSPTRLVGSYTRCCCLKAKYNFGNIKITIPITTLKSSYCKNQCHHNCCFAPTVALHVIMHIAPVYWLSISPTPQQCHNSQRHSVTTVTLIHYKTINENQGN